MAKWLSKLLGKGLGDTTEKIGGVIERVGAGHLGKKELRLEIEKLLSAEKQLMHDAIMAELAVKEKVMVAELTQDDPYTKRTRPYVIRHGFHLVAAMIVVHAVAAALGKPIPVSDLELWFVGSWAGLTGVYKIGRSAEKAVKNGNGKVPKPISLITGG